MENEGDKDDGGRKWKWSPLHFNAHVPIRRVKVKKLHYRIVLCCAGVGFYVLHIFMTQWTLFGIPLEVHWVVAVNTLFALDPTV